MLDDYQDLPALLTPAEAAHHLGYSRDTIYRWMKSGRLKYVDDFGGHRRIPRHVIIDLIEQADAA